MLAPVGAAVSSTAGGSSTTPSGVTHAVASSNRHIAPNATTTFLLLTVLPLISTSCFDYPSYTPTDAARRPQKQPRRWLDSARPGLPVFLHSTMNSQYSCSSSYSPPGPQ